MKILRAFKTELALNNQHKTACVRHAGTARLADNWGLARKQAAYEKDAKGPSASDLHRELNALKKTAFSWMYAVSKCAPQEALRDLDKAFANFFRRVKAKKAGQNVTVGYPRCKSKQHGLGSFRLTGTIRVFEKAMQLPRLGQLRLQERGYLPRDGVHSLSATVSESAGRWFVSLQVELDLPDPVMAEKPVVGVDLGINRLAQVSDGTYFENPHALKKLKCLQRVVSRRPKGSANRQKAVRQLARAHLRVANIRQHALHQTTT